MVGIVKFVRIQSGPCQSHDVWTTLALVSHFRRATGCADPYAAGAYAYRHAAHTLWRAVESMWQLCTYVVAGSPENVAGSSEHVAALHTRWGSVHRRWGGLHMLCSKFLRAMWQAVESMGYAAIQHDPCSSS